MWKWYATNLILFFLVSGLILVSDHVFRLRAFQGIVGDQSSLVTSLFVIGLSLVLLVIVKYRKKFVSYELRSVIMLAFVMGVNLLTDLFLGGNLWFLLVAPTVSIGYVYLVVFLIDGEVRGIRHVIGLPSELAISAENFSA